MERVMEHTTNGIKNRIDEFEIEGQAFIYLDLSDFNRTEDFTLTLEAYKERVSKYPEKSVFMISNVERLRFDSETKQFLKEFVIFGRPYIKQRVVIGFDGIKNIVANSICKNIGRASVEYAFSKDKAIEWLLKQDK